MDAETTIKLIDAFTSMNLYIQIAIPSGYLAYLLARCGLSHNDKPITIFFLSSVFALASVAAFTVGSSDSWLAITLAIITPLICGFLWRAFVHKKIMELLRKFNVANSTEFNLVWDDITQNTNVGFTQVTVYLKRGPVLSCSYIYDFDDAPLKLFRTDKNGNIALYITDEKESPSDTFAKTKSNPIEDNNGSPFYYRLTYIPKEEIERIEFVTNKVTSS
jgi:hypothetical protein